MKYAFIKYECFGGGGIYNGGLMNSYINNNNNNWNWLIEYTNRI